MKRILVLLAIFTQVGCAKTVYLEKVQEVKVKEYITTTDTLFIPKIEYEQIEVLIQDIDTSRLETTYAFSEAWVANGELGHSLRNKPESFKFNFDLPTLHRDSIIFKKEPYPVEVIREVKYIPTIYHISLGLIICEILALLLYLRLKK